MESNQAPQPTATRRLESPLPVPETLLVFHRRERRNVLSLQCHFFFQDFAPPFSVEEVGMEASAGFRTDKTVLHSYASLESFLKAKWQMMRRPKRPTIRTDVYEIRPRADKDGVDLASDALPYSPIWYCGPKAIGDAIDHAKFFSRSHNAVIRVYDDAGNVIETHEHKGDFKEP